MKKGIIVFIVSLMLFGCYSPQSQENLEFEKYEELQENLVMQKDFEKTDDFDTTLIYNELENEYRYDLLINNPKGLMYDITAMCYVDANSEQMFPNLGIFDEKCYHLKKDYINKAEGFYKGIQLSGKTKIKQNVKLYISYYVDEKREKQKELFIEVKDEIR